MPKSRRISSLNQYDRSTPSRQVARTFGDTLRARIRRVDPELDPLEAQLGEAPLRQQPDGARRHAVPARGRRDDVADLALPSLVLELDEHGHAEKLALERLDREACPGTVPPALLVPGEPRRREAGRRVVGILV